MKRRDLIKLFEKNGWWLDRDGGRHDIYTNGEKEEPIHGTGKSTKFSQKALSKNMG